MGATTHLAHQALLLHLATELAQSLLELLRVFDDYLQASITPFLQKSAPGAGHEGTTSLGSRVKDNPTSDAARLLAPLVCGAGLS